MRWSKRESFTYHLKNLPFTKEGELDTDDPSQILVRVPGYVHPVDIGSWCFTRRLKGIKYRDCNTPVVSIQFDSLREKRKGFVKAYIERLYRLYSLGYSSKSLCVEIIQIQKFVSWCDQKCIDALDSRMNYIDALARYTEKLLMRVRKGQVSVNSASFAQERVIKIGQEIFGDLYGDLAVEIRIIRKSFKAVNHTAPPEESTVKAALSMYLSLFNQLNSFVVNFENFPKKLELPNGKFWFFPNSVPFAGPSNIHEKKSLIKRHLVYDYCNGKILSWTEAKQRRSAITRERYLIARDNALNLLERANKDEWHLKRQLAATLAIQSFFFIFSAGTGMNLSQMANISWSENFEVKNDYQGFKTIKSRANGRSVEFFLSNRFFRYFNRYLALRKYVLSMLSINSYEFLFFTLKRGKPSQITQDVSTYFNKRLKKLFSFEDKVTTRMWRALKSDWLIRNADVPTASLVLQNTPETVLKNYARGSVVRSSKELTSFFDEFKSILTVEDNKNMLTTSAGHCVERKPKSIKPAPIKPDCNLPEGCLYCDKFRVVEDEKDYRKLLSMKYVLELSRSLSFDQKHFENVTGTIIRRLENLLNEIVARGNLSKQSFTKMEVEVCKSEKLDGYWLRKLLLLRELGESF